MPNMSMAAQLEAAMLCLLINRTPNDKHPGGSFYAFAGVFVRL